MSILRTENLTFQVVYHIYIFKGAVKMKNPFVQFILGELYYPVFIGFKKYHYKSFIGFMISQ